MRKIYIAALCIVLFLTGCGKEADLLLDNGQYSSVTEQSAEQEPSQEETVEASDETTQTVMVYIVGEVQNPGVYELPEDGRICDLVEAAGGFTSEAAIEAVNLAEFLKDAVMIRVPNKEDYELIANEAAKVTQSSTDAASFSAQTEGGKLNLNTASKEELKGLTGIGETRAAAIIAYRDEHGRFSSIEEITKVSGIGESTFRKIENEIVAE